MFDYLPPIDPYAPDPWEKDEDYEGEHDDEEDM